LYKFESASTQAEWEKFLKILLPRFETIRLLCESKTEDNIMALKKRLMEYESAENFLSYHYSDAMAFYKVALAQEWRAQPEFKSIFEKNARAQVEMRAIEPEAVLERFDRLIKGLANTQTALQTAVKIEEALLDRRLE